MFSQALTTTDALYLLHHTQKPITYWMYLIRKQAFSGNTTEEIIQFLTREKGVDSNIVSQLVDYYYQSVNPTPTQIQENALVCCVQRSIAQGQNTVYHYFTDPIALQEWLIPYQQLDIKPNASFYFEGLYQVKILDIEPDQTIHIELINLTSNISYYLHIEFIPKSIQHTVVRITQYQLSSIDLLAHAHAYWSCFLNSFRSYMEQKWVLKQAS